MNAIKPSTPVRPLQASLASRSVDQRCAVDFYARVDPAAAGRVRSLFERNPGRLFGIDDVTVRLAMEAGDVKGVIRTLLNRHLVIAIELDHAEGLDTFEQRQRHRAQARADFDQRIALARIDGVNDGFDDVDVGQEMLAEALARQMFGHAVSPATRATRRRRGHADP